LALSDRINKFVIINYEVRVLIKKILAVDDDPAIVEATTTLLETNDYNIVSASDGKEGLKKARSEKTDLILLDVMMARVTEGFSVARELSADIDTKNIPVVLIRGVKTHSGIPYELEPDEDWLPVKAILEKPVSPERLLKVIEENIKK